MSKKSSTTVRLDAQLIADARVASEVEHRTPALQIEYWAIIGRTASQFLSPDMLRQILSGAARVTAEPIEAASPDFDAVMAAVDADSRTSRELVGLSREVPAYQASTTAPGYLERLNPQGTVEIGQFRNGEFRARRPEADATAAAH